MKDPPQLADETYPIPAKMNRNDRDLDHHDHVINAPDFDSKYELL